MEAENAEDKLQKTLETVNRKRNVKKGLGTKSSK